MSDSSSTDDTGNEEEMDELLKQRRIILHKQRELEGKRKKSSKSSQIIPMSSADLRRIFSLPTKEKQEQPRNLKRRLLEFLNHQRHKEDAKAKLDINKIHKEQNKEEQKIGESPGYEFEFNEDRSKIKVKIIRDPTQKRQSQPQKMNAIDDFPDLRQISKKEYTKGLDRNGNILKRIPYKHKPSASKTLVRPKTQPIIDIGHIVDECANKFKSSIKNAIIKYTNFVTESDSGNKANADDDTSKDSQRSDTTSTDERSIPFSKWSKRSGKLMKKMHTKTQAAENLETQVSNRKLPKQPLR